MDNIPIIMLTIQTVVSVTGFLLLGIFLGRDIREISHIQRALFLMLRRQYGDIDKDLKEILSILREQRA